MECEGEGPLRPLLAFTPAPVAYQAFKNGDRKESTNVNTWTITPFCDCFRMRELSINCCCANIWPFASFTYGNALYYMGVGSSYRTVSSLTQGLNFSDGRGDALAQGLVQANAVVTGQNARRDLERALKINSQMGAEAAFVRYCCFSCMQCQEVDTVFSFYKDSLGYTDLQYGPWYYCQCCYFYATPPQRSNFEQRVAKVPFPGRIAFGAPGPFYMDETPGPYGYRFVQGVPEKADKPDRIRRK